MNKLYSFRFSIQYKKRLKEEFKKLIKIYIGVCILTVLMHGLSIHGFKDLGVNGGPRYRSNAIRRTFWGITMAILLDSWLISSVSYQILNYNKSFSIIMGIIVSVVVSVLSLIITEKICMYKYR